MNRKRAFIVFLLVLSSALCFGQAGALRDYVGLISIHYHPDMVEYLQGGFRDLLIKNGLTQHARGIDNILKGESGSGFIYVAPDGTNYVLTNNHVITQAESLSIAFEKQDGAKTTYDRLKILYVDEENDLAILVFDGVNPFTEGLSFASGVEEGASISAAGFPDTMWQFTQGIVSNANVRLPKDSDGNETFGPFIQHTAQVDPGNSGGPLLVPVEGVPTGFAVAGINTLSARWRQAANYAIPIGQINAFIAAALNKEPMNERQLIALRVDDFIKGLKGDKDVYVHIANFLSNSAVASNAEYSIAEVLNRGYRIIVEDPVEIMGEAAGFLIESSMRNRRGNIVVSLDSIDSNDKGGFNVSFNVDGKAVKSEWIKEYGVWRMDTYGDVVTGDKTRMAELTRRRRMRTDYAFSVSTGYANIFPHGSAINAALVFSGYFGVNAYFGLKGYTQIGLGLDLNVPIRINTFALMPFGGGGFSFVTTDGSKKLAEGEPMITPFSIGPYLKGGMMFTTAGVPGLFGKVWYQHNLFFSFSDDYSNGIKNHGMVGIGIGYGF